MSEKQPLDIAAWLFQLSPSPHPSPNSTSHDTPTKTRPTTRPRLGDNHSQISQQYTQQSSQQYPQQSSHPCQTLTHTALTELSFNLMETPSPSTQRDKKRRRVSEAFQIPTQQVQP